jgi:DNA-binding NarL/FixJ family response regulator
MLRLALEGAGYRALEAAHGAEAWDTLLRERPAIAIIDIQMPGDGLELCRKIRAASLSVKCLVYSANALLDEAMTAGADAFCTKDGDLTRFRQAVAALLT